MVASSVAVKVARISYPFSANIFVSHNHRGAATNTIVHSGERVAGVRYKNSSLVRFEMCNKMACLVLEEMWKWHQDQNCELHVQQS